MSRKKFRNLIDPLKLDVDKVIPRYAVFDIESNNWKDLVVLGYYDGENFDKFRTVSQFLRNVAELHGNHTIFAHNGGTFDFNFILESVICGDSQEDWELVEVLPRGAGFLTVKIRSREELEVYKFDLGYSQREKVELTFRDSLAMLPFSLKSLTEAFKTECAKGEWDHKNHFKYFEDEKLTEYLRDDCVGLYQVLEKYFNWPLVRGSGVSFTVASQALKIFRTFLKKRIEGCPESVDGFVRQAYFGGRTEIFRPYFKSETPEDKISCYDVNSLYPSVMYECDFPTTFKCFTKSYNPKALGFYEAEVEVPEDMYVPVLGTMVYISDRCDECEKNKLKNCTHPKQVFKASDSSEGKLIFPTGRFSGVWSTNEIEYARSLGVKIISTGKGAIFENGGKIFKPFIEELWKMRQQAEKDSVDSFLCKLIMNSSYGRFGLNLDREKLVFDDGEMEGKPATYEFNTGKTHKFIVDGKEVEAPIVFRFLKVEERIESFSNVAIAAWVTAEARLKMHRLYMKTIKYLFYTDTDSAFLSCHFESSKKLGEFKYEYSATEACFLLPKTYALAGITGLQNKKGEFIKAKAVIKGINSEAVKARGVEVRELYDMVEGDFKRLSRNPVAALTFQIEPKFAKVKSAMRRGTFLYVEEGKEKQIKSRYSKREIYLDTDGKYNTRPLHIENGFCKNYRGGELNVIVNKKKNKKSLKIDLQ
ncbi:MAG: DNA polymerase [Candidatus Caenarcaniphilales bacterium]|nr:DNA polymerase [Candidatus Caenarcaniphilales bacterium]